jgi:DNA polymerase III delta subunit
MDELLHQNQNQSRIQNNYPISFDYLFVVVADSWSEHSKDEKSVRGSNGQIVVCSDTDQNLHNLLQKRFHDSQAKIIP